MSYKQADNDNKSEASLISPETGEPGKKPKRKCPMCDKETVQEFRPFCSKRCADLDLGQWLNGSYAIAGSADSEEDGALPTQEQELQKNIKENE